MNDLLLEFLHIRVIYLGTYDSEKALVKCLLLIHGLYCMEICYSLNLCDDLSVLWSRDLRAILPVYLVTVVLWWIVAGCYNYTCCTSKLSDGI